MDVLLHEKILKYMNKMLIKNKDWASKGKLRERRGKETERRKEDIRKKEGEEERKGEKKEG